ncbi:MAG: rod-binding protein [Pseudomonadota bacterium]
MTTILDLPAPRATAQLPSYVQNDSQLREAAQKLEATFLAEMLKSAGLGAPREGFGSGGAGEEQFASFLRQAQAEEMARAGGIGLAEALFEAMKVRFDAS